MQEELNQFEALKVWRLVPRPKEQSIIGTKWIFKNKKEETGVIVHNKARLLVIIDSNRVLTMIKRLHLLPGLKLYGYF